MPFDPTSMAISAGMNLLGPLAGKAVDSLFGGLSPEERQARANLERLASGGSAPEDAMLQAQRAKTQSNLASLAARGTAQQQAGQTRAAMQMAPEIQQQQAAQLAAQRAQRMQSAQRDLALLQQQQGSQQRQFMQNLVGAGLQGGALMGAQAMMQNPDEKKPAAKTPASAVAPAAPAAPAAPSQGDRPYNEGAANPSTGQAQYYVPKPAASAGLVPMTAASREAASMARPSGSMGPEINIGASNQFTLSPELMPAIGADGGYKAPVLGLGQQTPLSLSMGGKQRSKLYGYDPLAFQPQMKLGGGY